ncbi:MAG: hypothetical protein CL878_07380 [Dehalococcoidia bacterium]|nr:hypothetical protein [Dehalococcoidia bacterium]
MVELQEHLSVLRQQDIWICAVSYDPVDVLAEFAERFGITYPLLSDSDSAVIRRFGILNTNIPPEHRWYGVPFPGTYMVDVDGRVLTRSFYSDHRKRDAVVRMVQDDFHITKTQHGDSQTVTVGEVEVAAYLSAATIRPGQVVTLTVEIGLAEGCHIYGEPLPAGYVPTRLMIEEQEGLSAGDVAYPEPVPQRFDMLDEVLPAYAGQVVLKAPIFSLLREDFVLRARLEYQVCDQDQCYLPQELDLALPIRCQPNIR